MNSRQGSGYHNPFQGNPFQGFNDFFPHPSEEYLYRTEEDAKNYQTKRKTKSQLLKTKDELEAAIERADYVTMQDKAKELQELRGIVEHEFQRTESSMSLLEQADDALNSMPPEEDIKTCETMMAVAKEKVVPRLDRAKAFVERAKKLAEEAKALQKEYTFMDDELSKQIESFDIYQGGPHVRQMRKEGIVALNHSLKEMDDAANTLNDMGLKFKGATLPN